MALAVRHWRQAVVSRFLQVSAFCASSAGQGMGQLFAKVPNPHTHQGQDSPGVLTDRASKAIFCVSTLNQ